MKAKLNKLFTLLTILTLGITNVWAEDVTWEGPYGNFVTKKLSDNKTEITITQSTSNSSKTISCIKSSNQSYLSINGNGKYLKFIAPTGYTITNIQMVWMSGAANQALPILFGEEISAIGTVETKDNAVTITNGGFKMTSVIATNGGNTCDSPDNIALPTGTKEVMIGRSGAYNNTDYATIGNVAATVKFRLAGSSGYFNTGVGTGSTPFIGRVTLTVVPEGYSITYHCNGATSGCPSDVASGATALPSTLATPEKTGFIFDKWYTDEGLTTPATAGATLTANANLYAGWISASSAYNVNIASMTNGSVVASPTSQAEDGTVTLTVTPDDGYLLSSLSVIGDVSGDEVTVTANQFTMPAEDVTVNATFSLAPTYTVTLNPAGGTIVDATGWTLNAGNYEKEVAEGTVLTLPTFTKTDRTFKTWRKAGPADVASPVTVDGDLSLTAIWTATIEQVIYSWEGAEGGATEVGGTAAGNADNLINQPSAGYYCLKIDGNNSYSANLVTITLAGTEKVKTGDKIKYWGFYNKSSNANARPKMRDANSPNASIFDDPNNLPNLYSGGDPAERTFTVPADINTSAVQLTRSQTGSNTWISKLQIIREVQVEEGDLLTVTFDANGGSAIAPVVVASGQAVAKPADPTKAHNRFNEWQLSGSTYNFSTPVTANITLVANWTQLYTISFANGGGSGDAPAAIADKAQGETFQVPANTFTAPSASQEFDIWNDGTNDYAPGATYTVGTENVILTAQWKALVAKYTVIFKDGETTLDTKLVDVGSYPSDAGVDKTKPLNTFAAWQKEGVDIALDDAFWATVAANAEITLTARWTAAYALDVNFKDAATQALGVETALNTYHYASDASDISFEAKGLKIKTNAARFYFNVAPGKVAEIKFGDISGATYSVDGGAAETLSASQLKATYSASAQSCVMTMTTAAYNIVENVVIHDPYTVSFDVNGGDASIANMAATPSITLPTPTKGSESFLGWFDALDNKIGEGGATYTPTADIELVAHWEAVSTDTRISALTYTIGGGAPVDIYEADKNTFNIALPYAQSYGAIVVSATPNHAAATIKGDAITQPAGVPGNATFTIVAQSGAEENYTVNFTKGPKDGVCIIKGNVGDNTFVIDEAASLFEGTADKNNVRSSSADYDGKTGWKFNSRPARLGLTLSGDETFQEGDVVEVFVTSVANISGANDKMRIFDANDATSTHVLIESPEDMVQGANRFVLPATTTKSLYLHRSNGGDYDNFNPFVAYFAVYRPMNPMLTAITINGETGTINESAKTVAVELQPGYDLAALTIVPTIVSNTAEASVVKTVTSNGGEWIIGDNTYRLTDKDGDYTEYTVTLTAGALKHTVTFDAQGGSAVDPQQVVDGENPVVPTAPTKDDYIFQGWAETADGAVVDVTSFTITAPKTFYAIWASDGAIKLLDGSTVNHTNFITGVTASTVEIESVDYNCVATAGNTSAVNNSNTKNHDRVIAYNATTTQTKIQLSLYNSNGNARSIEVKGVVEGTTNIVDLGTINLTGNEKKVTEYIEFNNAKNRTIYIYTTSNAGHIKILQVKVLETGTALPMAGDAGYSLNLNQGRLFGKQLDAFNFEGLDIEYLAADYTPLSSTVGRFGLGTSISFDVTSDVTMSLTAANNKTYYVTKGAAGTDNETSVAGVSEFNLTAGTWYITAGTEDMQFTNIAFTAPKCAEPSFDALANSDICSGDPYVALDGTATITDAGTVTYKWYAEGADESDPAAVLGTDATYTPSADGKYYVIATNSLSGYSDNVKKSDLVSVTTHASATITTAPANQRKEAGQNATLTVVATGKAPLTYQWYTCDDEAGNNPVLIDGAEDASYEVAVTAAMHQYYKVVVGSGCGEASAVALVEEWHEITPANVTGSRTWDWSAESMGEIATASGSVEYLMANVSSQVPNTEAFRSDMLYITANYANRGTSNKFFQGWQIRFYTEVPGKVSLNCRAIHGTMSITINGTVIDAAKGSDMNTATTPFIVPAGWVTIVFDNQSSGYEGEAARVQKIIFNATPDYKRDASTGDDWMAPGELGTVCIPNGAVAFGGDLYTLKGKDSNGKIVFETVPNNRMTPGVPYLFQATSNAMNFFYTDEAAVADPVNTGAMRSTFEDGVVLRGDDLINVYYFNGHALWNAAALTELPVVKYRAYVKMDEVPEINTSNHAPGRRYIIMDVHGQNATTGFGEVQGDDVQCTKMLINGQIFILRGEKMYDTTGRLVK